MKVDIDTTDVEAPKTDPVAVHATPTREAQSKQVRGGPFSSALTLASSITQDTQAQHKKKQTQNSALVLASSIGSTTQDTRVRNHEQQMPKWWIFVVLFFLVLFVTGVILAIGKFFHNIVTQN